MDESDLAGDAEDTVGNLPGASVNFSRPMRGRRLSVMPTFPPSETRNGSTGTTSSVYSEQGERTFGSGLTLDRDNDPFAARSHAVFEDEPEAGALDQIAHPVPPGYPLGTQHLRSRRPSALTGLSSTVATNTSYGAESSLPSRRVTATTANNSTFEIAGSTGVSLFGEFRGFADAPPVPKVHTPDAPPLPPTAFAPSFAVNKPAFSKSKTAAPFSSNRLTGTIEKPWLRNRNRADFCARWLFIIFALGGFLGGGGLAYVNYTQIPRLGNVCLVLEDNFDTFNSSIWTHEVEVSGWGNGEFEWTTANSNNSFVEGGILYIVPTLTSDVLGQSAIFNGLNLTIPDCTSQNKTDCNVVSNSTLGTIINPVQSARLSTRHSASVRYGRVEVRARMPSGDWLWPAIWMLPVNNTYGPWPQSGEIDLVESRGNGWQYPSQGQDWVTSTLHWGPLGGFDRAFMTTGWVQDRHETYAQEFHTYGLEWDEDFLWIYIDQRTTRVFNYRFTEPFFQRGNFPEAFLNVTQYDPLPNPWAGRGNVAPFDQAFYLILNVAVGGTNGWFPDDVANKPWINASPQAMKSFAEAQDTWYPTWPSDPKQRGMAIDWVKMYQKC